MTRVGKDASGQGRELALRASAELETAATQLEMSFGALRSQPESQESALFIQIQSVNALALSLARYRRQHKTSRPNTDTGSDPDLALPLVG